MPPFTQHLRGSDLIVVDPRRTATAELASLHLAPAPGTDLALALGILHAVVADAPLCRRLLIDLLRLVGLRAGAVVGSGMDFVPARPALQDGGTEAHD